MKQNKNSPLGSKSLSRHLGKEENLWILSLWESLRDAGSLSSLDPLLFIKTIEARLEYDSTRKDVKERGHTLRYRSRTGRQIMKANPSAVMMNAAGNRYLKCLVKLKLTPLARSRKTKKETVGALR